MDKPKGKLEYVCPLSTCESCEGGVIVLRSYGSGSDYLISETPCPYYPCQNGYGYIVEDEA